MIARDLSTAKMSSDINTEKISEEKTQKKKKLVKKCSQVDKFEGKVHILKKLKIKFLISGRYLFLDSSREILTARRLSDGVWYSTNESNQVLIFLKARRIYS